MANDGLLPELDKEIAFQDKWADIMSWSYTSMSALAVIASGAATVVAALGHSTYGAILAAVATVTFGVEKALMLREKWVHNRTTGANLRSLRLALVYGGLDTKEAAQRMGRIMEGYAVGLPITPRSEAPEEQLRYARASSRKLARQSDRIRWGILNLVASHPSRDPVSNPLNALIIGVVGGMNKREVSFDLL